ncbi:MAG: hypothetical protein ACOYXA_14425 [Bacteroidota bacterium]
MKLTGLILLFMLSSVFPLAGQTIEVDGGMGYAAVNLESWSGISETGSTFRLYDWSNFTGYASLQVLFPVSKSIQAGVSAGYQHLFWYEWKYFYDTYNGYFYYQEADVNASRFLGIVRLNAAKLQFDLGLGTFVFDDFADFTTLAALIYPIKLTDQLSIPVKVATNIIFDSDATIVPLTLGAGLSYRVK